MGVAAAMDRGLPRRVTNLRCRRSGRNAVPATPWFRARGSMVIRAARCRPRRAAVPGWRSERLGLGPRAHSGRERVGGGADGEEVDWWPMCGEGERD